MSIPCNFAIFIGWKETVIRIYIVHLTLTHKLQWIASIKLIVGAELVYVQDSKFWKKKKNVSKEQINLKKYV